MISLYMASTGEGRHFDLRIEAQIPLRNTRDARVMRWCITLLIQWHNQSSVGLDYLHNK